jgi:hypothetical protein
MGQGSVPPLDATPRPVIGTPWPLPVPAPPLRTKLGAMFRLRLPADYCRGCGKPTGGHYPSCYWRTRPPRLCRACQAPILTRNVSVRYCDTCRADACVYCHRYAGAHKPSCASAQHTRRVPLPYLGVVTEAMVLEMYVTHRDRAVRLARDICGSEAEDIVQDVTVYFFTRLGTLRHVSRSLFLTAVKRAAIHRITDGWWRHAVPFSDDAFAALEKEYVRHGRDREMVSSPSR